MRCLSFYGLALLLLLLLVAQVALAQIVYPRENTCRTPNGRTGECINLKRCPELLLLLQQKPLPDSAVKYLQQSQCGFEGMDPTVCCAKSGNPSNPPTQPPATDDSQPPDVTNHPNLRLLDHQKCGPINVDQKIVGGEVAGIFEFPWMALLAYDVGKPKLEFRCGGSIINNRYILTAAHCVTNLPSNLRLAGIRVGEWDTSTEVDCQDRGTDEEICSERYQDFGIESFHFHELHSQRHYQNDIALIRVNAPIDFRPLNTRPICMPIGPAAEIKSTKLKASGWGLTEDLVTSPVLLKVNLPIYPMDQCAEMLKRQVPIWRKQICMGGAKGKDSCRGDSGGPLQGPTVYQGSSRYVQYGIVSLGMKMCGTQNFPGVYTRVTYYLDWILNTMRD